MINVLLLIMMVHVFWTAALYVLLTVMRAPKIWNMGAKADGSNPWETLESRVSANLSNQFEWPLFFHAACIVLLINPERFNSFYVWLGSIFIVGRLVHSAVHIGTTNIRLRGVVFTVNFIAVLVMWALLGVSVLQWFA